MPSFIPSLVSLTAHPHAGRSFAMVAYNPLAHQRVEYVRLPIPANRRVTVFDYRGSPISSSLTPVYTNPSLNTLVFAVTVPPLGHTTVFVNYTSEAEAPVVQQPPADSIETIENGIYRIAFDTATGLAKTITDLRTQTTTQVCGGCVCVCA